MSKEKKEAEMKVKKFEKDTFGTYLTVYDLFSATLCHDQKNPDCKGNIKQDDYRDDKLARYEIGWKCTKCGESWRIAVRRLRNTMNDPRLKEFGSFDSSEKIKKVLGVK